MHEYHSDSELNTIQQLSNLHQDGRIEQFLCFYTDAKKTLSAIESQISQTSQEVLNELSSKLRNLEEIDLLILTSVELAELGDDQLTCATRSLVIQIETQRDSLSLYITAICPEFSKLCQVAPKSQIFGSYKEYDDITSMSTISEESDSPEQDHAVPPEEEWPKSRLREHMTRIIRQIDNSEKTLENILHIFETNYKMYSDFKSVDELIENLMAISMPPSTFQTSRLLKLLLSLCAINCRLHGLDLHCINTDKLSELMESMHRELCLSTDLLIMFHHVVKMDNTRALTVQECGYVLQQVTDLYAGQVSILQQSVSILILQRLYRTLVMQRRAPKRAVGGNILLALIGLLLALLIGLLCDNVTLERFGQRPQ